MICSALKLPVVVFLHRLFITKVKSYGAAIKLAISVLFHWSNEASAIVPGAYAVDHVGIIESVNSDGSYTTIEGIICNTGGGNGAVLFNEKKMGKLYQLCTAEPDYVSANNWDAGGRRND